MTEIAKKSAKAELLTATIWFSFILASLLIGAIALRACLFASVFPGLAGMSECYRAHTEVRTREITGRDETALRIELDELRARLARAAMQCVAGEPDALRRQAQNQPEVPLRQTCAIPGASNVMVVMDRSTSMRWDFNANAQLLAREDRLGKRYSQIFLEAQKLEQAVAQNPFNFQAIAKHARLVNELEQITAAWNQVVNELSLGPGVDRFDIAKKAVGDLVDAAASDVTFDFLTFSACGAPQRVGNFPPSMREQMKAKANALRTHDSTALADALEAIPASTSLGREADQPINIVLLSDGVDSCGGDPCAAARRLKANMPHAIVSVISMAPDLASNACIAEVTGGRFFRADQSEKIASMITDASGQGDVEECVKANQ